jgi:replicative DNA helicase
MTDDVLPDPFSLEAEQGLLGAILISNVAFDRVSDFLQPQHFYEPMHGKIFEVMARMIRAGRAVTPVTIKDQLPQFENLDLTVNQYLAHLAAEATTIFNAVDFGRLIRDLATRRGLIEISDDLNQQARHAMAQDPDELIEQTESKLYHLAETSRYGDGFVQFDMALAEAVDLAARAYQRDGGLSGLATGLIDLDGKMGGLQKSDLIILAGRPGMGKTALATNIAYYVAQACRDEGKEREGVGFFSLEMSREQLATRIIAEQTGIPSNLIRRGSFEEPEFHRIRDASERLAGLPLYIDEAGGLSIAQVTARARRLKRQHGLSLLVIDYLQLMHGSVRRQNENRVMEVTEITTGLKTLAKDLDIPILAVAQLSRQVESRDDKRPQLADLRESGSIEQDADVVLFVFREEYYHLMRKPSEQNSDKFTQWLADGNRVVGKAELIIAKQRHGPTGTLELQFESALTRFSNLAAPRGEPYAGVGG